MNYSNLQTTQKIDRLEAVYASYVKMPGYQRSQISPRVFLDIREGRWGFHTLGCTVSYAGKTERSAVKKMQDWDADSAYWEAHHAGYCK